MNRIAFISENIFIYWSPIVIMLAGLAAMCAYAGSYLIKGGKITGMFVSFPLAVVLSVIIGRFVHWYCRSGSYESFSSAMTDYSQGDFALVGVFIACLLTACILRLLRLSDNLPKMLDAMSIGACIGIPLGRLSPLFTDANRGMILPADVGFPFAYPMINAVSGEPENRLATFMFQCGSTAMIAILLLTFLLVQTVRKCKIKDGDICLIFLTAYCSCQIICDSTRYDALVVRSNGFVSMVQIVGLIGLLVSIIIFSVRMVRNNGLKFWHFFIWTGILGMLGLAGYMEYFVQNNGTKALFAYSCMSASLLTVVILVLVIRFLGNRTKYMAPVISKETAEIDTATLAESTDEEII